jgi:methionine-rich copper-binding protein CopC
VTVANSSSLQLTTAMTLEAWVNPAAATNFGTALFKESTVGDSYSLYAVNGSSQPPAGYIHTSEGEQTVGGTSQLPVNTWSHLALTDDGTTLALYVNGRLVGSRSVPGALTTSTGALRIGGNSIYGDYFNGLIDEVRVYNRALNPGEIVSDMSTPVGGSVETTAPTVTMNTPTVSGTVVTLSATAADNVAVAGVQFLVNGQPVGAEVTTAPFTLPWNTIGVTNGGYSVTARVRDYAGNITTSAAVPVQVSNPLETTPPAVVLRDLTPNATVGGTVVLSAVASDNVGVVGVQFKANGVNVGSEVTVVPYRVVWNAAGLPSGTYAITAVARDAAGNTTTSLPISLTVDSTPPTITGQTPAAGATGLATSTNPTVTFSESVQHLSFVIKDPAGNTLASTVSYNDATRTATLFPAASLVPSTTYTVTVSGATDLVGNVMAGSTSWSFATDSHITGATIWPDTAVPAVLAAQNDSSPIEVGVKFRTSVAGSIAAVMFYKGAGNTGTHVVHLWTSAGTLLGTATATNETASGWQQAAFATPIPIAANTTYVASYYAPNGHYSFDSGYFASAGVTSYPLQALANGVDGGNGVFTYATGGGFPNGSYQAANYWVDVTFSTSVQDTTPPAVTAQSPAPGAAAVPVGSAVTVTFTEPVQASTVTFTLRDASGNAVPAAVAYNDATQTATLTPTAALAASGTYTATVSGVKDAAGNPMAAPASWTFSTTAPAGGSSVWTDATVPAVPAAQNDSGSIEVGLKFRSDTAGYITGLRFYKGAGNTGVHVGHLWSSTGTLLGTAAFANETATGWQQVTLSSPVPIAANTTYVVSYLAPNGHYAFTSGYFATAGADAGNLHALANGVDGGNGLFAYTATGAFPTGTYQAANYWVDVTFSSTAQDNTAPAVSAQTPAPGATAVPVGSAVTVTFTEPVQASTVTFTLRDATGNAIPAAVAYNSTTQTATLTPAAALGVNATYTATVGASDLAGNVMATASWSFSTPGVASGVSLWPDTATPAILNDTDVNPIEVGVRLYSEVGGQITGLRFYKGPTATGTHVGHLWANDGTLLATATFTNESASGWQQVTFAAPVTILPNTLYVASYYAPSGRYSATPDYFATTGVANGYLHAPANGANGGNGLYGYVPGGGFPTNTYRSVNYWVDVLFTQGATDVTAPTVAAAAPAAGASGVLPTSPLTITFSEPVQAGTISLTVRDSFNGVVAGNLTYNQATHVATFIPAAPLFSFVTYTVTLTGVKDLSGNTMAGPVTWSFTTQGVWTQTTVADFGTGTHDGTVVTNTAGGEVQLAPLLQEEFAGTSLDGALWTGKPWASDGGGPATLTVAGGVLTVGGRAVLSAQSLTNAPVEALLSFGAAPYQHFGLVTSFDTASGNYWALFSTWYRTDRLFARVNANGVSTDVDVGARPDGFHTYRVEPTAAGFDFYVDGVRQASIAAGFQATVAMKAGISDYSGTAGQLLQADRLWFESYSTTHSGTFTSTVFDASQQVTWGTASWTASVPTGTSITVQVRAGDTAAPDGSWSGWVTVTLDQTMLNAFGAPLLGRYLQYRVILTTTIGSATPVLDDISFTWL